MQLSNGVFDYRIRIQIHNETSFRFVNRMYFFIQSETVWTSVDPTPNSVDRTAGVQELRPLSTVGVLTTPVRPSSTWATPTVSGAEDGQSLEATATAGGWWTSSYSRRSRSVRPVPACDGTSAAIAPRDRGRRRTSTDFTSSIARYPTPNEVSETELFYTNTTIHQSVSQSIFFLKQRRVPKEK